MHIIPHRYFVDSNIDLNVGVPCMHISFFLDEGMHISDRISLIKRLKHSILKCSISTSTNNNNNNNLTREKKEVSGT